MIITPSKYHNFGNINDEINNEQLIDCIKTQNEDLKDGFISVIKIFANKKRNNFGAIIEVDCKTYNTMLKYGKISIGWNKSRVEEYTNVKRCFKCCGYNHKSSTCRNKMACLKCGKQHKLVDCDSETNCCINCEVINNKFKINLDTNHAAWNKDCRI